MLMGEVAEATFFRVVNRVLAEVGREPLKEGGSHQRAIGVVPTDRVLQILAGPGSGKTEVLVWRALYELLVFGTPADRLLVTTFTRRAATELQVRIVERCDHFLRVAREEGVTVSDPKVHDLRIGTIHSLCDALLSEFDTPYVEAGTGVIDEAELYIRIARNYRLKLGYNNPPQPKRLLNRLLDNTALTGLFKPPWDDSPQWPGTTMERVGFIVSLLSQHIETWLPRCRKHSTPNGIEAVHGPSGLTDDLIKLAQRWEEYLDEHHILDFATIQKRFWERQATFFERLSHVFVDEFQDNNPIQFALHTGWLAVPAIRLTVVGDDDQALYRFRGSDIECFSSLEPHCKGGGIGYRLEKLETNYRSTKAIVSFSQDFKAQSVLAKLSMPKTIVPDTAAPSGDSVRLLEGPWQEICKCVAAELAAIGAGRIPAVGADPPQSAAVLMFSTSERSARTHTAPALDLRNALEAGGMRAYNPRNRMAAAATSPVSQLFGAISYLVDPISKANAGSGGRSVMVAASMEAAKAQHAKTQPPGFQISEAHLWFQKAFVKANNGDIGCPAATHKPALDLIDKIRSELANTERPRLTLAGFISRLLSLALFRNCGFTTALFRQALFTSLLEANIAPTRLTMESLDTPLEVVRKSGRYVWSGRFWSLLNVFGAYLDGASLDDPEVESFEQNAVLILTFHQSKGLEFDHVYVAGTGRKPDISPALRTRLFSGTAPGYKVGPDGLTTRDKEILGLAVADREREVYVAMTRAKSTLTILHDPKHSFGHMPLNEVLGAMFRSSSTRGHPGSPVVSIRAYRP